MSAPDLDYLDKIAEFIYSGEAEFDHAGHLKVYRLPHWDGGGTFEVAGINDKYNHDTAFTLVAMIEKGYYGMAKAACKQFYIEDTKGVLNYMGGIPSPAIEAFLRDTAFNRGMGGCARILQTALGVKVDGSIGPKTKTAFAEYLSDKHEGGLLLLLRRARESYERLVSPPVGDRAEAWQGLVHRWDNCLAFATTLLQPESHA